MNRGVLLSTLAMALSTSAVASDLNPLGFYVGAAIGQARDAYTPSGTSDASHTGWKVMTGLQPLAFFGAEFEYLDFGDTRFSAQTGPLGGGFRGSEHSDATGLYALAYLPIPLSHLDVFAKVGGERTHTTAQGIATVGPISCGLPCMVPWHVNQSESDFAYGGGVRVRLQSLALRAEYERTDTAVGHPSLLSLGLSFTF